MATVTANQKYKYDQTYHGHTLDQWIQLVHKNNAEVNKWKYFPLKKGAFGYDNLAISLVYLFLKGGDFLQKDCEHVNQLADLVHKGWIENYTYWRDNQPWLTNNNYFKPAQALGDDRRNLCASTEFADLPEEEKVKDVDIATYVCKNLGFIPSSSMMGKIAKGCLLD